MDMKKVVNVQHGVSNRKGELAVARLPVSNIYERPVHLCDIEFSPQGPFASSSPAHLI